MGKISKVRLLIQALFTALSNGYIKGFAHGKIYQGDLKYICVPGMNCYSCPGALGSCPIGALQSTLNSRSYNISLYVFGLISLFGVIFGITILKEKFVIQEAIGGLIIVLGLFCSMRAKLTNRKKSA